MNLAKPLPDECLGGLARKLLGRGAVPYKETLTGAIFNEYGRSRWIALDCEDSCSIIPIGNVLFEPGVNVKGVLPANALLEEIDQMQRHLIFIRKLICTDSHRRSIIRNTNKERSTNRV